MNGKQKKLMHFTKATTVMDCILKNKTLRFNNLRNVNDPRESKNWPFKIFCFYEQNSTKFNKELLEELHNYVMNHILISCFATLDNYDDWNEVNHDMRMWSQYAENHTGVCIIFNKNKLENAINQHLNDDMNLLQKEIDYIPHINLKKQILKNTDPFGHPFLNPECTDPYMINLERLLKLGIPSYMELHINYFYKELFFTKKECWRDEREYRYLIYTKENKEFVDIPIENCIDAIILGNDFPLDYYNQLFDFSDQLDFKIYRIYSRGWENHLFEVNRNNLKENVISIDSSFPINFYYENLFSQVCDLKGNNRILKFETRTGNLSIFH